MSLCTLSSSTSKLQVLLGGAVSTSECPLTATVEDVRKDAIGGRADPAVNRSFDGITTGGTAVDLVAAPPSNVRRKVVGFSLFNDDTASVIVTVRLNENGTTRVLFQGTLLTDQHLYYSVSRGWYAVDTNGAQKTTAATEASTALSTAQAVSSLQSLASVQSFTATNFSTVSSQVSLGAIVSSLQSLASVQSFTATNWSTVSTAVPATVSSLQSLASVQSFTATNWSTVSSGHSLDRVVSSLQSLASVQSFTATSFSTVSSTVSRVKSSFTW